MPSFPIPAPPCRRPPPVWNAASTGQPTGYGGFWIRLVAYIIDGILLIVFGIVGVVIGVS